MIRRFLIYLRRLTPTRVTISPEPYGPTALPWQEQLRRRTAEVPRP